LNAVLGGSLADKMGGVKIC